jgi:hypothetical protein
MRAIDKRSDQMRAIGIFSALFAATIFSASAYATSATINGTIDTRNTPTTFSKLPTCSSSTEGSIAAITDDATSVSWGAPVTGGGSAHVAVYCDGTFWQVFGGASGSSPPNTTAVLPAPSTNQGNYATGCSGGSCLTFDDHWTSSSLNTANWYPAAAICINGSVENCGSSPGSGGYAFPLSGWCWGAINGCQDWASYDYPYGIGTNSPGLTHNALAIAADGSLALGIKLYSSTTYPTASNNVLASSPYCTSSPLPTANCTFIYWTGAAITSGGLSCQSCYPATVNNTNAIIPVNGGIFQWRMKLDSGLQNGAYPVMECDAVGGRFNGYNINANFEFGYNYNGHSPLNEVGLTLNNAANNPSNINLVTTGDDGVGSGDLRNWHKFALEWTGTSTHQWHYYVDGVELPAASINETNVPTVGWNCKLTMGIAQNQTNGSFHSLWDTGHPGPFFMYVSDTQFYKKPGT